MAEKQKTSNYSLQFYIAWAMTVLFYFYQYILRVSPGVMVVDLRQEFKMTAEEFSSLGAFYLYAYSLLQIPLGILIDRVGVRRTILSSIFFCVIGAALLSWSSNIFAAQMSRLLIGAGSAAAFMASLKIVADHLPLGRRGFLIGFTLTLGTVGALTAGKPQVWLLDLVGWRSTVWFTALFGIVIWCLTWIFLRLPVARSTESSPKTLAEVFVAIREIIQNRRVMIYASLAIGVYTPLSVLADLWGTAFLMQKYNLDRGDAAQTSMLMYLGLAIGSFLLPWACEKWRVLDRAIQLFSALLLVAFSFLLFGPSVSIVSLSIVLMCLGIFCGAEMMCFTGALQYTTAKNSGMTIGIVNTFNMLGGALLQQAIGFVLDMNWQGRLDDAGVRIYETREFVSALSLLFVVIAVCVVISLKLRSDVKPLVSEHTKRLME